MLRQREETEEFVRPQVAVPVARSSEPDLVHLDALLAGLKSHANRRRSLGRTRFWCGLIGAVLCGVSGITYLAASLAHHTWLTLHFALARIPLQWELKGEDFTIGGAWIVQVAVVLVCYAATVMIIRQQTNDARRLPQFQDMRTIGPLAEALGLGDRELRSIAREAVISLLPRLRASDSALLTDDQRRDLRRELLSGDTDLSAAILRAYMQIGTGEDSAAVRRLAATSSDAALRELAATCLPSLDRKAEMEYAVRTYVRPAAHDEPATSLLRAVGEEKTQDSSQLLRPSDG